MYLWSKYTILNYVSAVFLIYIVYISSLISIPYSVSVTYVSKIYLDNSFYLNYTVLPQMIEDTLVRQPNANTLLVVVLTS